MQEHLHDGCPICLFRREKLHLIEIYAGGRG